MTIVKFQRGITTKLYRKKLRFLCSARRLMMLYIRLWFLCSARHLMMLYISMKFHENILNGFQVIERTRNDHCQISNGE